MILLLNNLTTSLNTKIGILTENAESTVGSDYFHSFEKPWLGDELTVESLFPSWIVKEYNSHPNSVTIVPIIKNYLRWLFSIEYGYGAQLNWENLRVPLFVNDIFLEAYADFYFPEADFSQTPLNAILPNIRNFLIKSDANYFDCKGTEGSIKYAISTLLQIPWNSIVINSLKYSSLEIKVATAYSTKIQTYKTFLEKYIIPAGTSINYTTF
jgi:hypothetical protein